MEPFDPSMFFHRVTLYTLGEGADPTASLVESFTPGDAPLPCRVRSTLTRQAFAGELGELTRTEARVAFPADPGCGKGDRLVRPADGLTLRVLAPARARDGDGVLFVADCEVVD